MTQAEAAPANVGQNYFGIKPVEITLRTRHDVPDFFASDRSIAVMARLRQAAREGQRVTHFSYGGLELDADAVAGLNCYLRAARAMGRMHLPFDRLPGHYNDTRYDWYAFVEYLGLQFR